MRHDDTTTDARGKEEDGTPFLQQYILGPARFVVFLLSLALLARKDDERLSQSERRHTRKRSMRRARKSRRSFSKTRSMDRTRENSEASDSASSVDNMCSLSRTRPRVLHTNQRKLGALEVSSVRLELFEYVG